jgi:8-oxo-dGTP pyrophosphatase MutT (NUDIX family)
VSELVALSDGTLVRAGSWRVAVVLAVNAAGEVLQVPHPNHGWVMPSGKIELAELPLMAAYRELKEETGLRAYELRAVKPFTHGPYHTHLFVARGTLDGELRGERRPDGSVHEARWAPAACLSALSLETIARGLALGFIA